MKNKMFMGVFGSVSVGIAVIAVGQATPPGGGDLCYSDGGTCDGACTGGAVTQCDIGAVLGTDYTVNLFDEQELMCRIWSGTATLRGPCGLSPFGYVPLLGCSYGDTGQCCYVRTTQGTMPAEIGRASCRERV